MTAREAPRRGPLAVHLGPDPVPVLRDAIVEAGGRLVPLAHAEAVIWTALDPESWLSVADREHVRWVQLMTAGVDRWLRAGAVDPHRVWTSAAGASAATVAEHALALLLAVRRRLVECARTHEWTSIEGTPLAGSTALLVGCGATGQALLRVLTMLDVRVVAVTRTGRPVEGALESHGPHALDMLWPRADIVVLTAPATPRTWHLVDVAALTALPEHAVLVNVARGSLVDTDALVAALRAGVIAGAGLDVTDPEPLPPGHPLWRMPNVLVTSHHANPTASWHAGVARHVAANIARYLAREPLLGQIDRDRHY